ncbi:MAG: non-heme iron oxygenase ferredoxin subunit [Micrococcales bacterium]|nr:non-heme iron oxygenase ferredoxin subunit [Micrococcales bacterium]
MTAQMVCRTGDVPVPGALRREVDGVAVAVVRDSDGTWHAISDLCSHGQVSLSEGEVVDGTIECWAHAARFDLATGAPTCLPAVEPVPVYPVTIDGDQVLVDVANPISPAVEGD